MTVTRHRALLALLVLVAAANAPSLRWPFMNDDWALLHTFQSPGAFRFWITPMRTPLYRPLAWGGLALQHSLFGLHPLPYHLVALACVLGASAALYGTALRLGLRPAAALIAGLAFGVHPAMAWGVGWMCCIGTPMGELFGALALRRLLDADPSRRDRLLGGMFMLLAIGSHETFAVLPVMVLIVRFGVSRLPGLRARARSAVLPVAPHLAVVAGIVLAQTLTKMTVAPTSGYYDDPLSSGMLRNVLRLLRGLTGVVLARPAQLASIRSDMAAAVIGAVVIAAAVAAYRGGRPLAVYGLLAVAPCTLPAAVLVNQAMNPYYLEVALLPFALVMASIAETLLDAYPVRVQLRIAVPVAAIAAAAGALVMTQYWTGSLLGHARSRQAVLVSEVRAEYGATVPASIRLVGSQVTDSQITYRGYMFGVLYGNPDLRVSFAP